MFIYISYYSNILYFIISPFAEQSQPPPIFAPNGHSGSAAKAPRNPFIILDGLTSCNRPLSFLRACPAEQTVHVIETGFHGRPRHAAQDSLPVLPHVPVAVVFFPNRRTFFASTSTHVKKGVVGSRL